MRWFKHDTDSINNEDISDAEDEFGDAGYSVFFKMLELYGRKYSKIDSDGFLSISSTFVRRKLRKSSTKVQQILNFYQKRKRFVWKPDPEDKAKILFKDLNFKTKLSNWTQRQEDPPTEAPTEAPTASRTIEGEGEVDKDLKDKAPPPVPLTKETIEDISTLKLKDEIKDQSKLVEGIFPGVYKWMQKLKNKNVNPRAIVLALMRLNLKSQGETIDNPWGYCNKIVKIENGNFNEADHRANRS